MDWIKTFPCCACGKVGNSDPAHTNVFGRSGMSQKTSDRSCVPLCRLCHREMDAGMRRLTFEADHGICLAEIVARYNAKYLSQLC